MALGGQIDALGSLCYTDAILKMGVFPDLHSPVTMCRFGT